MKFMVCWRISPGNHKPCAEAFLKTGAPAEKGLTMIGRWHAPGSVRGWALFETKDPKPLYEHAARWANLLESEVTPVVEDADAAEGLAKVYGK